MSLIAHNVHPAYPVGNCLQFYIEEKAQELFKKNISREELLSLMADEEELVKLEVELKEMDHLNS